MTPRLDPFAEAPELLQAFLDLSMKAQAAGLDKKLVELVKIRSSQMNRCANCLNMHTADAHKNGESDQRLHLVAAWQEAPVFSDRERAALAWTERLTELSRAPVPDAVYEELDKHFSKAEQVVLTMMINVINAWNRLAVGFHLYNADLGWK